MYRDRYSSPRGSPRSTIVACVAILAFFGAMALLGSVLTWLGFT